MTTPEAVAATLDARADAMGFVFAQSVRKVTPQIAADLAVPARGRLRLVAVTRHPSQEEVEEILRVFRPDVLQTDVGDLQTLRVPMGLGVMPVVRGGGGVGLKPDLQPKHSRLLFEGPVSGVGSTSDWSAAAQLARTTQLVLAGGLNATNIADAIAAVRPFGVDVSSGVEASPGIKDPARIHEFVQRARAAANGANR